MRLYREFQVGERVLINEVSVSTASRLHKKCSPPKAKEVKG